MGLLTFRALTRQQGQHTGPAREQATRPAGLADAVTKTVQGPHRSGTSLPWACTSSCTSSWLQQ